jgi:DNA-directed RNA polymerase specialized sigma24 family protein
VPAATKKASVLAKMDERSTRTRLGELYEQHADRTARLAYLLTGDRTVAEDLTQEAFVRLARAGSSTSEIATPPAHTFAGSW